VFAYSDRNFSVFGNLFEIFYHSFGCGVCEFNVPYVCVPSAFFVVSRVGLVYHVLHCGDYGSYEWFVVVIGRVRGSLEFVLDNVEARL
jgi:hypothetical protein